jgi:hypothetical protein
MGLIFLFNFITENKSRERLWSIKSILENMENNCSDPHTKIKEETFKSIRTGPRKPIELSLIIKKVLLNSNNNVFLRKWFTG